MKSQIKRCIACGQVKLLADFNRHPTTVNGRQGQCRACESEAAPRRRHGMTRLEKAQAALAQGGCLTCSTLDPGRGGWVVDHDHLCCGPTKSCRRCRRGILCARCNSALGMARDDPAVLRRLADYLDQYRASKGAQSTDQSTDSVDLLASRTPDERTDGLTEMGVQVRGNLSLVNARVARGPGRRP